MGTSLIVLLKTTLHLLVDTAKGRFLACCLGMTNTGLCSTCVSCQYTNACSFYIDIKMGKTQITAVDHNILLRFWPSSDAFSRPQGDTKGEIKACFARQAKWGEQRLPPSNGRNSRGQIINRCLWSDRNHALCWSSWDVDSSTRSVAERAGGRMLPLPLRTPQGDVLAPRYPKPCGTNPAWKTLAAQTSQRLLRPSVSSVPVPPDAMQELGAESAFVFLQVQTLLCLWKRQSLLKRIIFTSHQNDPHA